MVTHEQVGSLREAIDTDLKQAVTHLAMARSILEAMVETVKPLNIRATDRWQQAIALILEAEGETF